MKLIFCLMGMLCLQMKGFAQAPVVVNGQVRDADAKPMEGVIVRLKGTAVVVVTKGDGKFSISAKQMPDTLEVIHTGYISQKMPLNAATRYPLTISLTADSEELADVTVSTGYQQIPRERASGSFVRVDEKLLNRRFTTNLLERLEGVVPGLVFNRNTADGSDGGIDLSIRGNSTLFANDQPLIVVDNFPYDGDIRNLNAADIESVTVLKDAAAASIWGARSGNGVIVITTKKGKRGQPLSIQFTTNHTVLTRPDIFYSPTFIPSADFIKMEQILFDRGYYNADLSSAQRPLVSPVVELLAKHRSGIISSDELNTSLSLLKGRDVRTQMSDLLYRNGYQQQYALNLKGGSPNMDYMVSGGVDNNQSNVIGNKYFRKTIAGQFNLQPTKRLHVYLSLNYSHSVSDRNGITSLNPSATKGTLPYLVLKDDQGNDLPIEKDFRSGYLDTAGRGLFLNWKYRPLEERNQQKIQNELNDVRLAAAFQYEFLKGLSCEVRYQQQVSNQIDEQYYSEQSYFVRNIVNTYASINGSTLIRPVPVGGILDKAAVTRKAYRLRTQFSYQYRNDIFQLAALAGAEIGHTRSNSFRHRYYGYSAETTTHIPVDYATLFRHFVTGSSVRIPNSDLLSEMENRFISYYTNMALTFYGKYTLTASARVDKSNIFGVAINKKQIPLYSFGVNWNLLREKWMQNTLFSDLRFRLTYGFNGNLVNHVTAFTTMQLASTSPYYSRQPFGILLTAGNPELQWEKIRMTNMAIDFAFLKGKLNGSAEFYFKKGMDLAAAMPLASSSGFSTVTGNYAETKGHGFDVSFQYKYGLSGGFHATTNLIISGVWDKVTSYSKNSTSSEYIMYGSGNAFNVYPRVGFPLYSLYSYKWAGLDPLNGDPMGYLNGQASTNYGAIISGTTLDNIVYSGPSRPVISASIRQDFTWRGFSLSMNFVAKLRYYFRRGSVVYPSLMNNWIGHKDYLERWQKSGDELHTNIPSLPLINNVSRADFYSSSELLVERGDHIRMQDIRVSWSSSVRKVAPRSTPIEYEIYTYINNPGIIWRANKKGLDPDLYSVNLPMPVSYTIGVNLKF